MTPDDVRDIVLKDYPQLVPAEREYGWTFFYRPRSRTRILTVTQSSVNAPMRLLKGTSCRLGPGAKGSPFHGNYDQVRAIIDEEIREYEKDSAK